MSHTGDLGASPSRSTNLRSASAPSPDKKHRSGSLPASVGRGSNFRKTVASTESPTDGQRTSVRGLTDKALAF